MRIFFYFLMQVGVPGAFTPSCSSQVPGYLSKADEFFAKGVSAIYVVSVNDAFVLQCAISFVTPLFHYPLT